MSFAYADRTGKKQSLVGGRIFHGEMHGQFEGSLLGEVCLLIIIKVAFEVTFRQTGPVDETILCVTRAALARACTHSGHDLNTCTEAKRASGILGEGLAVSRFGGRKRRDSGEILFFWFFFMALN